MFFTSSRLKQARISNTCIKEYQKFPSTKPYMSFLNVRINLMLQDTFKIFCIPQHSEIIYQFENNNNNNDNLPSKKTSVYHGQPSKENFRISLT